MTSVKTITMGSLIIALMATSSLAFAQDAPDAAAPAVESPEAGAGTELQAGDDARSSMRGMRGENRRGNRMMRRLDGDDSGDISLDEFGGRRLGWVIGADADDDGVLTVDEITTAMEERRKERREARLLRRFDIDGDGEITVAELERQQEERFALMDRDDDGALSADEMPRRPMGHRGGRGHGRMGGHMGWHHGR